MSGAALDAVFRRDRAVIFLALAFIVALAWAYVLWLAAGMDMASPSTSNMNMAGMNISGTGMSNMTGSTENMPGADMPGTDMSKFRMIPAGAGLMAPHLAPWSPFEFAVVFVMWAVMMIGMMTPSAAPMILIHARVARQAAAEQKPFAATLWFAAGYLAAWTAFALAAASAQWALERASLLSPMMAGTTDILGGAILIVAGIYQWTPAKNACLAQCHAPLAFIQRHGGFRRDASGALSLGLRHGAYCVGCCWALMALLFVGGVMNVFWIAGLAIFVLLEKLVPAGRLISRIAGCLLIASGAWLLVSAFR